MLKVLESICAHDPISVHRGQELGRYWGGSWADEEGAGEEQFCENGSPKVIEIRPYGRRWLGELDLGRGR